MSFDLRVTFTGLTLFVPDPDERKPENSRLHVFLPDMNLPAGHNHPHFARLVYDSAHTKQGSTQFTRNLVCRDVGSSEVVFPEEAEGGLDLSLNGEIQDLDRVFGAGSLKRTLLDPQPVPSLAGRVSFSAGTVSNCRIGARFTVGQREPERMTWQVEWTLRGVQGDHLEWGIRPFSRADVVPLEPLYPIGQTIHVGIHHVPESDLPPLPLLEANLADGDPEHVRGYYAMQQRLDPDTLPIPVRLEEDVKESGGCKSAGSPPDDAGSPPDDEAQESIGAGTTNCVTGRATLEPA